MFERIILAFIILFLIVLSLDIIEQEKSLNLLSAEVAECKLGVLDAKKKTSKIVIF